MRKHTKFFLSIFSLTIFAGFYCYAPAQSTQTNQKFFIEKITIEGNTKTRENVVYENLCRR
jgi:outer membrane protein assembly factor BamA